MPYNNVPEDRWGDMDRCVQDVMDKQGVEKQRAIAICHASIVKSDAAANLLLKREWTQQMRDDLAAGKIRGAFAGPNKSFPIAGPEDVRAAYMSAGRAGGDPDAIRSAVIRIAKKFGWESGLPDTVKKEMEKSKSSVTLHGIITKAQQMPDGRVKWQARVNSGKFDSSGERIDKSLFEDVVKNFAIIQEAMSRGEPTPLQINLSDRVLRLPEPILDIAHYSYFLGNQRLLARTGYPIKVWLDGDAFMAQGYYDKTRLGELASKAALAENDPQKRRVSIGLVPDWGLVEALSDGKRVYKGGRGLGYLDHIAMTAHPVDAQTEIITLSEVDEMPTQKDDAVEVLGTEAEELVSDLEKAKVKSDPLAALLKNDADTTQVAAPVIATAIAPVAAPVAATAPTPGQPNTEEIIKSTVTRLVELLPQVLDAKIKSELEALGLKGIAERLVSIEASQAALAKDDSAKLKAALDSKDGDWLAELITKNFTEKSVQHNIVVKGDTANPVNGQPAVSAPAVDPEWARLFGNPE